MKLLMQANWSLINSKITFDFFFFIFLHLKTILYVYNMLIHFYIESKSLCLFDQFSLVSYSIAIIQDLIGLSLFQFLHLEQKWSKYNKLKLKKKGKYIKWLSNINVQLSFHEVVNEFIYGIDNIYHFYLAYFKDSCQAFIINSYFWIDTPFSFIYANDF